MNNQVYTTGEVAIMLDLEPQSVSKYYRKYGIGKKPGRDIYFTAEDIEEIKATDGRMKD